MGQELIGFIVRGPAKLSKAKARVALRNVKKTQQIAQVLVEHLAANKPYELPHGMKIPEFMADYWENGYISNLQQITHWIPEKLVEKFVEFWNNPCSERDATFRPDPDDKRQKLVFAGEVSWGAEPGGDGYQILKRSLEYGICEAFGVR